MNNITADKFCQKQINPSAVLFGRNQEVKEKDYIVLQEISRMFRSKKTSEAFTEDLPQLCIDC